VGDSTDKPADTTVGPTDKTADFLTGHPAGSVGHGSLAHDWPRQPGSPDPSRPPESADSPRPPGSAESPHQPGSAVLKRTSRSPKIFFPITVRYRYFIIYT
jgi:hypothetical protein